MTGKGFTLVELLIVVAIIGILAAIAIPNFLGAQTRAKVARARADMMTITTAIEAYAVDNNDYPPNDGFYNVTPVQITTPVQYLTKSRLVDPFAEIMVARISGEFSWNLEIVEKIWGTVVLFP